MSKTEEQTDTKDKKATGRRYTKVTSQFGIDGVEFDNLADFLGVMKNDQEYIFENFEERVYFDALSKIIVNPESVKRSWEMYPAYTAGECLGKFSGNEQRLMIAMKYIGPENLVKALGGDVISEETITKTQQKVVLKNPEIKKLLSRTNKEKLPKDAFPKETVTYEDTYRLIKVPKETYHKNGMPNMNRDAHIVECVCPSKGDHFFLSVPADNPQCSTAFGAIAWTFKYPDGTRFTIEDWKKMAYEGEEC